MTVLEFLALPPRERDAMVAERIYGWRWFRYVRHFPPTRGREWWRMLRPPEQFPEVRVTSQGEREWEPAHGDELVDWRDIPWFPQPYTTDPARALEVMEAVPGHWWRIQSPFRPGTPYWVGLTEHDFTGWNGRMESQVAANTREELPAACCAVALLALGVLTQ